ncbi:LacI family DNA-binding transcriptional regulator [Tessaracoccus sp. ZS01]|uniref:LacI family DNA-binding transcriptional regulator n=1 Tax=Tessaracoccus sp. ZS01 TaxID=1906324 RepID=UPI00096E4895|nr:LacI family DNA-binding transcriptional regulator [Tessaracoccus sp. ZS01]MCG6566936.1 LacI family transcriptional regulator [Tessaracoccus sp. ZS01]OMG58064.1 LacI family transcriptional regulator [Tessaracoccus sp. ZS01]
MALNSVTIADVAKHAGVSRAAVSKVIREAYGVSDGMRTKVQAAIDELGYRPSVTARAMRGRSYTIGIEVPTTVNAFLDDVIEGASSALSGTPYKIVIAPAGPDYSFGPEAIQVLADRQVDGILAVSPAVDPEWLENLGSHIPLILLGRHDESVNYDTIVDDDVLGTRLVMEHLHALGHRDIAHLTIEPAAEKHMLHAPHAIRAATYREWMTGAGLAEHARVIHIAPTEGAAHDRTLELLDERPRPTAIYAGHDELAMGVLSAAAKRGLGPADLSVVGYDDTRIAAHPLISLTSVYQAGAEIGALAMRLILERLEGRTDARHEVIIPELRTRGSSTAPVSP